MRLHKNIVVIDDDRRMLRLIQTALKSEGYIVFTAERGEEGAEKARDYSIDLVILDLDLPDIEGLELARKLRVDSSVPILMLTGFGDVASRVKGLDAGADDYLAKPFDVEEFRARVRSILRRTTFNKNLSGSDKTGNSASGWRLEASSNSVIIANGRRLDLTEREFLILTILMQRSGDIVSRDELQRQITGQPWRANDRSLDVHVHHLRRKLREFDPTLFTIRTVRNKGFVFRDGDDSERCHADGKDSAIASPNGKRMPASRRRTGDAVCRLT